MPLWSTILKCQMQFNSYNFRTNRLFSRMEISMILRFLAVGLFAVTTVSSQTPASLPSSFQQRTIHSPEGADIFVRWGGSGPVVLLIHGYAENSDSWAPLAADLMKDHTVVVPDLRGIGRSSKPADGYEKKTQAKDMRAVVTSLGYDKTFVVAHDIGNMRSEEHTSELQSLTNLVCRLLLE